MAPKLNAIVLLSRRLCLLVGVVAAACCCCCCLLLLLLLFLCVVLRPVRGGYFVWGAGSPKSDRGDNNPPPTRPSLPRRPSSFH